MWTLVIIVIVIINEDTFCFCKYISYEKKNNNNYNLCSMTFWLILENRTILNDVSNGVKNNVNKVYGILQIKN